MEGCVPRTGQGTDEREPNAKVINMQMREEEIALIPKITNHQMYRKMKESNHLHGY